MVIIPIGAELEGHSIYREEDISPKHSYDQLLYDDIKEHHFQEIIKRWEKFLDKFESYNQSCLAIVERIKSELETRSGLPQFSIPEPDKWAHYINLAEYIFHRALGLAWRPLRTSRVNPQRVNLMIESGAVCAFAEDGEIELLSTIIEESKDTARSSLDSLNNLVEELERDALKLIEDLERLLESYRLPGTCPYCKV